MKPAKILVGFICLSFVIASNARWQGINFANLLASSINNYAESVKIRDATPDSDRLHDRISDTTVDLLHTNFLRITKKKLRRFKKKPVILIFDETHEPFYGKTWDKWIREYKPKKGCTGSFEFIGAQIIQGRKKLFFDAIPVGKFTNKVKFIKETIETLWKEGIEIEVVLVDRGFTKNSKILDLFNKIGVRYLGLALKWDNVKQILLNCGKELVMPFEVRGVETTLIVNKTREIDWTFLTNIELNKVEKYIRLYKKRWNIETGFRVQDEARILTKSVLIQTRYFYFLAAMVLYNEWKETPENHREPFRRTLFRMKIFLEKVTAKTENIFGIIRDHIP